MRSVAFCTHGCHSAGLRDCSVLVEYVPTSFGCVSCGQHICTGICSTFKSLGVGVYCRAVLGVVFFRCQYDGLTFLVSRLQQHILPLKSVLAGMGGKWQLITIICDLVPSKKQISGNESSSLLGRASSSNCLSVCLSVSVCSLSFVNFYNDSLTQQQHFDDQRYSS